MGPIGLLAEELARSGGRFDEELKIYLENENPIGIRRPPWQDLKRQIENIVKRKRIKETTKRRTHLGNMDAFDNEIFNGATQKCGRKKIFQYITSGAWF